jgi:hypothetical protein
MEGCGGVPLETSGQYAGSPGVKVQAKGCAKPFEVLITYELGCGLK